jgi:hypothetical protein
MNELIAGKDKATDRAIRGLRNVFRKASKNHAKPAV